MMQETKTDARLAGGISSPAWRQLLRLQRPLLWVLVALAAVILATWLIDFWLIGQDLGARLHLHLGLGLTPLGWRLLTVTMAVLLTLASLCTLRHAEPRLTAAVLVLLLADLPAFLLTHWQTAAVVGLGLLTLVSALVVRLSGGDPIPGRRFGRLLAYAVAVAVLAFVVLGLTLLVTAMDRAFEDFGRETDYVQATSPDGRWLAVGTEYDGSAFVSIRRDIGDIFRLWRDVYVGGYRQQKVRWLDSRTIRVGPHRVDIYRDSTVDGYH